MTTDQTITHIYEIVDITDDERYFPLGLFLTESEAVANLDSDEPPCDDNGGDSVVVEVRKKALGWHPHEYVSIARRQWTRDWESESEDWKAGEMTHQNRAP